MLEASLSWEGHLPACLVGPDRLRSYNGWMQLRFQLGDLLHWLFLIGHIFSLGHL